MNRVLRWAVYLTNRLLLEFMSNIDMYTFITSNDLVVKKEKHMHYTLTDVNNIYIHNLTNVTYCSLEECVKAIIVYHRDK